MSCQTRNLLLRHGYFGGEHEKVALKLARAHKAFKEWCRQNKIDCSQPEFRESTVTSQSICKFVYALETLLFINIGHSNVCSDSRK